MTELEASKDLSGTIPTVAVLILRNNNREVLLVKHKEAAGNRTGIYGLPAGRIESGETPREAAIRELMQETGLVSGEDALSQFDGNYFATDIERHNGGEAIMRRANMTVYACSNFRGELRESDETIPEWVEVSKISELEMMPNISFAISNYIQSAQK